jgi:hypothetical protein
MKTAVKVELPIRGRWGSWKSDKEQILARSEYRSGGGVNVDETETREGKKQPRLVAGVALGNVAFDFVSGASVDSRSCLFGRCLSKEHKIKGNIELLCIGMA